MRKQLRRQSVDYAMYENSTQNYESEEHIVIDARSLPSSEIKLREKEQKRSSGKAKTILLTSMITLLAFSLTLFLADLLGTGAGVSAYTALFHKKKSDLITYFAVYATRSEDMSLSYKNAAVIRKEGGAGYVMKEGDDYYVILNVYESETDAKKIVERQTNYAISEISFPPFDTKKCPELAAAESSKDLFKEAYQTLYEAANDLSSGKYAKEDMLRSIATFKEKVIAVEEAYAESIRAKETTEKIEYKVFLAETRSAFENLEQSNDQLVSDARYYSVMIVRSFALFCRKYFN